MITVLFVSYLKKDDVSIEIKVILKIHLTHLFAYKNQNI